ncbi:MAG: ABC transporter permease [Aggregatilineales bacterium]
MVTVIVGVILAATIGANVPLYTSAVSQIGMIERLNQQSDELIHIYTRITYTANADIEYSDFWQQSDDTLNEQANVFFREPFPNWVRGIYTASETAPLIHETVEGDLSVAPVQQRLRLAYYEDWQNFVTVVDGNLPEANSENYDDVFDAEAVIAVVAANEFNIHIGDIISLQPQSQQDQTALRIRISGIIQESNLEDPYWITPSPLRIDRTASHIETNLLLTRGAYNQIIDDSLPEARTRISWRILFDYEQLRFEQSSDVINALNQFETSINTLFENDPSGNLSLIYTNEVVSILRDYREEVSRLNAPFGLLLLQIGAMVLLFLVVIVTLVRRGERREIALLQSRGSYDGQILWIRGIEAMIIVLIATLISPLIARQILIVLVPALVNVERLRLSLTSTVYLYAGIAAFSALFVLIMSLRPVLRLPLISAGGSALRSETKPWWQKYYLDVLLMLFGLLGLWRLLSSNSTLIETNAGVTRADPLLLLTPAILFVAIGSLLLRFFPALMTFVTGLLSSRRGLGGLLAGWQVSREPLHYSRITFLLALSIGIGWFATSFQATIVRSQADQTYYRVGSDLRLTEFDTQQNVLAVRPSDDYDEVDGVDSITQVRRFDNVGVAVNTVSFQSGELLAVDHRSLENTAFWRSDLGELLPPVDPDNPPPDPDTFGVDLPLQPSKIGLWANMPQPALLNNNETTPLYDTLLLPLTRSTGLTLSLIDESNTIFTIPLRVNMIDGMNDFARFQQLSNPFETISDDEREELRSIINQSSGWVHFEGMLTESEYSPVGNIRLLAVNITYIAEYRFSDNENIGLYLTDLTLTDEFGEITTTNLLLHDSIELATEDSNFEGITEIRQSPEREDSVSRYVEWHPRDFITAFRLPVNYVLSSNTVIPAIVSNSFLELNNLDVGLDFTMSLDQVELRFHILDSTNFYPTMYQDERPFIIIDLTTLQDIMSQRTGQNYTPNETWIKLQDDVSESDVIQALQLSGERYRIESVESFTNMLENLETDPLSLGLIGLLFLSFIIVLVLSIISLLTYAGLTAQFRRAEFGVLRALGVSSTRLILSMALEQVMVTTIAVFIGAIIGVVLSTQILPTLATSITTQTVAPPFIVQTETNALLQYGLVMVMILFLVLIFTLLLVRQLSLAQAIKLGEE